MQEPHHLPLFFLIYPRNKRITEYSPGQKHQFQPLLMLPQACPVSGVHRKVTFLVSLTPHFCLAVVIIILILQSRKSNLRLTTTHPANLSQPVFTLGCSERPVIFIFMEQGLTDPLMPGMLGFCLKFGVSYYPELLDIPEHSPLCHPTKSHFC